MKNKKLFISLTAVGTAILSLFIFLCVWFFADVYPDFEGFRKEFAIPGLDEGACPQGMGNCSATVEKSVLGETGENATQKVTDEFFFISAYMNNKKSPSRVYVTGKKSGYIGYVSLKDEDGKDFYGHVGGIATNGGTLWVASGKYVYVAKVSETKYTNIAEETVSKAAAHGEIQFTEKFNANCNAAFLYYYDDPISSSVSSDRLYVGEFYRKGNYETAATHRVTTPNGDRNTAFVMEYNADNSTSYGLTTLSSSNLNEDMRVPKIQKVISITGKIQGFARTGDGKLTLSQSYGLANSSLLVYDWAKVTDNSNYKRYSELVLDEDGNGVNFNYEGVTTKNGNQFTDATSDDTIYVYFADKGAFDKKYSVPCMSEGLCVSGNRIYVLFESGAKKYKTFVRQITDRVHSFIPA